MKMQQRDLLLLIKKGEEEVVIQKALALYDAADFPGVIELLTPYYDPKCTTPNLQIIRLLAASYSEIPVTKENKIPYSLWKILYQASKNQLEELEKQRISPKLQFKTYNSHPKDAFMALISLVRFTDNLSHCGLFVTEGVKLAEKYPKSFIKYPPMPLEQYHPAEEKDYLATCLHNLCYEAARVYNDTLAEKKQSNERKQNIEMTAEALLMLREKSFKENAEWLQNAKKYYKMALSYKPNDLISICAITCLVATERQDCDCTEALKFLLSYEPNFKENPHFYYAVYKLYSLSKNEKAGYFYNKYIIYSKSHTINKDIISVLNSIGHCSRPQETFINNAIQAVHAGNYLEAKEILVAVFMSEPDNYEALEISANVEKILGNLPEAMIIYNRLLGINPRSPPVLQNKASLLWNDGENLEQCAAAALICEEYYQYGYRNPSMLRKLVIFYESQGDHEKSLKYAAEYSLLKSSVEIYYYMAIAQIELLRYVEAIITLRKVRALDEDYMSNDVSADIIFCSFKLAELTQAKEDYKKCAKKISSYLSHLGFNPRDDRIVEIINKLKEQDIEVHESVSSDIPESKSENLDSERRVQVEVKNSVQAAMKRMTRNSFKDEDIDSYGDRPVPKLQIKSDKLFSINESGTIKGYIDPDANLTAEDLAKFQTALETGRLLKSDSKGLSGIKKSKKGGWKIKIMGSGMRLKSAIVFFKPREGKPDKFDTIIEFGKLVRKHN